MKKTTMFISIRSPLFTGLSGATNRVRNYEKHWDKFNKVIFTPQFFANFYGKFIKSSKFITSRRKEKKNHIINLVGEYLARSFILPKSMRSAMDLNNFFIFYSSSEFIADLILPLFYKLRGKKFVWFVGLHLIAPKIFKGYKKMFMKGLALPSIRGLFLNIYHNLIISTILKFHFINFIMVSNSYDKKRLLNRGYNPNRVIVMPGGVNLKEILPHKNIRKIYDACFLGRFHEQKGIEDLPFIWYQVVKKKPSAKLIIIGEGNNKIKKELEKSIRKYHLEKNIFLKGDKQDSDKYKLMMQSEVFVCPSYYESFGMVILEAMACGVPVVAYQLPFYKDFYSTAMVYVEIGNKKEFAKSILKILNNNKLKSQLIVSSKEIAKNFTWEKSAKVIEKRIINEMVKI